MVDQFKTQVMFLHPEPSLMEPCARLLGDNYSVHMAASGTEALTTLGITPIDIIVSAQDLPGMTGQEALKEAKRRSPDTRGILLASPEMTEKDRLALMHVKHLNEVLYHHAGADEICEAIQKALTADAPGSMRVANDQSAGHRPSAHGESTPAVAAARQSGPYSLLDDDIPVLEPGAANEPRPAAQSISEVEIVVLTNDGSFLKTIRAATGSSHIVNHAPNLQAAIEIVQEGQSGVLITDAAVAVRDVETITAKLRRHKPSLVTIVAGRREDGEKMMSLISDGLVYRFLLKPISPGRTRLAIEASAKKHLTLANTEVPLTPSDVQQKMTETGIIKGVTFDSGLFRTTDVRPSTISAPELDVDDVGGGILERLLSSGALLAAVAAILIAGAVGFWLLSGDDQPATAAVPADAPAGVSADTAAAAAEPAEAPPSQPSPADRAALLAERGQRALVAGRVTQPADDNAVLYFAQATALVRGDTRYRSQLDAVLQQAFASIEADLLADRIGAAGASLAVLNKAVPGHPRLAFYNRQVTKELARRDLERAEAALLAGDGDAATDAIERLAKNGVTDRALVEALRQRLAALAPATVAPGGAAAEPADADSLLELAALRVSEGRLIEPANDSARFYYQAVVDAAPDNAVARQGLTFVASMLISESRSAASAGDLARARRLLDEAVATGANRVEATAVASEIDKLASRPTSASAAAARAQSSTEARATDGVATGTTSDDVRDAATSARESLPTVSVPAAPIDSSPADRADENAEVAIDEPTSAAGFDPDGFDLVQIDKRAPAYPRSAQRRGIEGWADVEFIVRPDGTTDQIVVSASQPGSVFDNAAVEAVRGWRYEPLDTDNPVAYARSRVRLEFNLEQ